MSRTSLSHTLVLLAASVPLLSAAAEPRRIDFTSCAKPAYPQADITAQNEGAVTLRFLVKPDGTVADSQVKQSSGHPTLDEAAREALSKCRFSAAPKAKQNAWTAVQYVWALK